MSVEIVSRGMGVAELRDEIVGSVYVPGDADYDRARQSWNLTVVQEPRMVVDAETAGDVQAAVRFARAAGLPIAVMATGHGTPRGCDGLLIRTSRMISVRIDAETRQARVEGGALVKDVLAAAAPYGLAMLSGSSPNLGVVGYILGGGYGLMVRKHGLAIDRVVEARIVTPDGRLVTADSTENPDLFWAIRGGGGAFGVVVEMTIELVPQASIFGGATVYPADDAARLLREYAAWTRTLPEEVTSTAMLMNLPPLASIPAPLRGRAVVIINACVCGDLSNAETLVAPVRNLATPVLDVWGTMPYAASECIFNDPTEPMPACGTGALLHDLSDEVVRQLCDAVGPIDSMPQLAVQLRHIGGGASRVAHEETPVGRHRAAEALVYMVGVPNPFVSAAALYDHAEAVFQSLGEAVMCRGPINFVGEGTVRAATVRGAFGEAEHARLCQVKRAIDPDNTFRFASVGLCD